MRIRYYALALLLGATATMARSATPVFHHTFSSTKDESGKYVGALRNGATLEKFGDMNIVDLGENGGYFDLGASVGNIIKSLSADYTISTHVFVPESTPLGANGNFVYCFSHSSSTGYLFFGANSSRYSITQTNWSGEQTVNANVVLPKGEWVNVVMVQKGNDATIYFNGEARNTSTITLHPSTIGTTPQNWLGKSPYSGDVDLIGARYADFRIYDVALSADELSELSSNIKDLNDEVFAQQIDEAIAEAAFDFSDIRSNIVLPNSIGAGITCEWESDNTDALTSTGVAARGTSDVSLKLTLTATKGEISRQKTYDAVVRATLSDQEAAEHDLEMLTLKGNINNLRSDLLLPSASEEGSIISWKSSDESYITNSGRFMRVAPKGNGKQKVTLTAIATKGEGSATRDFEVYVAEDEGFTDYLFAFFPSNNDENLYYAIGSDGFNYTVINHEQKILNSADYAIKKGIRDPHIIRGEDGNFYMVATDMKSAEGWSSNRGIVLSKSSDLVHWTHATVHFPDRFPEWKNVTRVWAPEVIYDAEAGKYLIYYSLLTSDGKVNYDKVYYSYANADFTDLETAPVYFYDRGSATIDCDIIYDENEQLYHMVFKNEGIGGICQVTAKRLTPEPGQPAGSQWSKPSGTLQQTNLAVEGGGMFRLINTDTWVLMYDCYMNGFYQFCTSTDLYNFTLRAQTTTSGAFTPRHGVVLPITAEEKARLLEAFPVDGISTRISGAANPNVRSDNFELSSMKVYVPVRSGVDLSNFDPQLVIPVGATITPTGAQDFSKGAVNYTVTNGSASTTYAVTCAIEANPVLPGFTADPEVMFSNKTKKFYIYPTTDGIAGWGGYQFYAYSSTDLVNWTKENCILDLSTSQVPWATGNAWAPCIEEKFENGAYRYYFYYSGHNPEKNYKTLGCAVADSPTGPFYDLGSPIIDTNITSGQLIDSDIFTDEDGQTYYYWGNGSLVASKLADDMCTISDATVITPQGGSLSTYAFREGVYVFKRNGIYYFMWSVDDTGATNYHVAYGTSTSPMGPITVADSPVILKRDSSNHIYGTGHNSVIQIPGRDEWYVVYHRINRNYVSNDPGVHREVCIDRLYFNADGTIKPVVPTHVGITPVDINADPAAVDQIVVSTTDADIVVQHYYTASGLYLGTSAPTATGLYIRIDFRADGTISASKIAVR